MYYSLRAISKQVNGMAFVNVFLCFLCFSTTYADDKQTIRGTHWGMTVEQVKGVEKWEYKEEMKEGDKTHLLFKGELKHETETNLLYTFHNGLLVELKYQFDDGPNSKEIYRHFATLLFAKYGLAKNKRTEAEAKKQTDILRQAGYYQLVDTSEGLWFMQWEIHDNKTFLQLTRRDNWVFIAYENLEYRKQRVTLEKDKERDANYSVTNSDDL